MERAVVHSDLNKREIQPQSLLLKYQDLLAEDIFKLILPLSLEESSCPVSGERSVKNSFSKMGMFYRVSKTMENIYLSPRPDMETLRLFYSKSIAREFWLKELWPKTKNIRIQKIILPQLDWVENFISQFGLKKKLEIAEFLPNHWGYYKEVNKKFSSIKYNLVEPLFNIEEDKNIFGECLLSDDIINNSFDIALLFESLDRSPEPANLLQIVKEGLKPGGLCFITCLLSSGFEVQSLGEKSEVFVPPERMNLFSFEGLQTLLDNIGGFEVIEFSTPGVLDIPNVIDKLNYIEVHPFFNYILRDRKDPSLVQSFQDFLQINRLGTFGRLVLKKN
ncbi:MAG: hypothetical protein CMG75_07620 [Candidatus Marinimicrobia bacterium]|nr:hypothetical protein [Candidatus Neomarinimicrobiota bacterium]|tara:strand:+ start:14011 stop:15012 length:1002 start_codon:yes stop_codon:yes gene_type:complete